MLRKHYFGSPGAGAGSRRFGLHRLGDLLAIPHPDFKSPHQNRIYTCQHLKAFRPGDDADVGNTEKETAFDDARYELQSVVQRFGIVNRAEGAIEDVVAVIRQKWRAVCASAYLDLAFTAAVAGKRADEPPRGGKSERNDLQR